jgi:hypothetical protein
MYAAGSPSRFGAGRFFAVREVVSGPTASKIGQWSWELAVREIVSVPLLEQCPTVDKIGVEARAVKGKSYIRLKNQAAGPLAEDLLKEALAHDS